MLYDVHYDYVSIPLMQVMARYALCVVISCTIGKLSHLTLLRGWLRSPKLDVDTVAMTLMTWKSPALATGGRDYMGQAGQSRA